MEKSAPSNVPPEVGATLQRLRQQRSLTLEDLSRAAGVSKSMLSQIEREKANPTIAVAWRLANALGIGIAELLSTAPKEAEPIRILESHETPTLPGAHAGYVLRILGPMELAGKFEWYELTLAPGGALVSNPHDPGTMRAPYPAARRDRDRSRRHPEKTQARAAPRAIRPIKIMRSAMPEKPKPRHSWW